MEPIPLDDPIKYLGHSSLNSYMGQSGFMVKKRNLPPLLSFSALLVSNLHFTALSVERLVW